MNTLEVREIIREETCRCGYCRYCIRRVLRSIFLNDGGTGMEIPRAFLQDATIYECNTTACRFNGMNVHHGRDIAGRYCTFKSIDINENCRCTMFEDMSDHGLEQHD